MPQKKKFSISDDDNAVYNAILARGRLRSLEIRELLSMGFHRLYPSIHRLKNKELIKTVVSNNKIYYQINFYYPELDLSRTQQQEK